MTALCEEIAVKIRELPDGEKLQIVDMILGQLDRPDPEIDRAWAAEATKRWEAYKAGTAKTIPYDEVMARFRVPYPRVHIAEWDEIADLRKASNVIEDCAFPVLGGTVYAPETVLAQGGLGSALFVNGFGRLGPGEHRLRGYL